MTTIKFPPLPEYAPAFRPRWAIDVGGFTAAQMRARDLEAARFVLEAAAKICMDVENKKNIAASNTSGKGSNYLEGQSAGAGDCLQAIRALRLSHE